MIVQLNGRVFDAASLRDARKERGLTQMELASLAGISLGALNLAETGRVQPNRGTRKLLELAFEAWDASAEDPTP